MFNKKGPVRQTQSLCISPRLRQPERNVIKSDITLSFLFPPVKSQPQKKGGIIKESYVIVVVTEWFL